MRDGGTKRGRAKGWRKGRSKGEREEGRSEEGRRSAGGMGRLEGRREGGRDIGSPGMVNKGLLADLGLGDSLFVFLLLEKKQFWREGLTGTLKFLGREAIADSEIHGSSLHEISCVL